MSAPKQDEKPKIEDIEYHEEKAKELKEKLGDIEEEANQAVKNIAESIYNYCDVSEIEALKYASMYMDQGKPKKLAFWVDDVGLPPRPRDKSFMDKLKSKNEKE